VLLGLLAAACTPRPLPRKPSPAQTSEPRVLQTEVDDGLKLQMEPEADGFAQHGFKVVAPAEEPPGHEELVASVKAYIYANVRNPKSVKFVRWYPPREFEKGRYIRCQYQTFGGSFGTIMEDKVFYLNRQNEVVRSAAGTSVQY